MSLCESSRNVLQGDLRHKSPLIILALVMRIRYNPPVCEVSRK
jgi:hypothetical protein